MGIGGLLSFVRLAIELLMAGSQAADGAGFQLSASGSKKQIPIISFAMGGVPLKSTKIKIADKSPRIIDRPSSLSLRLRAYSEAGEFMRASNFSLGYARAHMAQARSAKAKRFVDLGSLQELEGCFLYLDG
jgi:hypothetical protein